jgi:uncharacterized protein (DUF433 family)
MQDSRYYSVRLASKIGGISHRQALTWAKNGVLVPSRGYATNHRPYILFYSFADLVALRVIAILREDYGLSLESARVASNYIQEHPDTPWKELNIWLADKQVQFDAPLDASATRLDLESIAAAVREDADKLWYRNSDDFGKIEYRRDVMGGTLVVKGTRISVATVANLLAYGWDIDKIREGYPTLQVEDIRGVMQYVDEQRKVA